MMKKIVLICIMLLSLTNISLATTLGSFPLTITCNFQNSTCTIPGNNTINIRVESITKPFRGKSIQKVNLYAVMALAKSYKRNNTPGKIMQLARGLYFNSNAAFVKLLAGPNVVANSTVASPQDGWRLFYNNPFHLLGEMKCTQIKVRSAQKCMLINEDNK